MNAQQKFPDTLEIEFIESDIAEGKRGSCSTCPTALAFARALGGIPPTRIAVGGSMASVYLGPGYVMPPSLRKAIAKWDWGLDSFQVGMRFALQKRPA